MGGKAPGLKPIDLSFKLFFNEFVADAFMVGSNDHGEIAPSISFTGMVSRVIGFIISRVCF